MRSGVITWLFLAIGALIAVVVYLVYELTQLRKKVAEQQHALFLLMRKPDGPDGGAPGKGRLRSVRDSAAEMILGALAIGPWLRKHPAAAAGIAVIASALILTLLITSPVTDAPPRAHRHSRRPTAAVPTARVQAGAGLRSRSAPPEPARVTSAPPVAVEAGAEPTDGRPTTAPAIPTGLTSSSTIVTTSPPRPAPSSPPAAATCQVQVDVDPVLRVCLGGWTNTRTKP